MSGLGLTPSLLGRVGVGLLYSQGEVVGLENAAVAQAAGLTGSCELHEAGTLVRVDGDGDALFAPDAVSVGSGHIPYAPGNALEDLSHLSVPSILSIRSIRNFPINQAGAFGDAPEF